MPVSLGPTVEPIPGYRLLTRLGRGGFGEVWKAEAPGGLLKAIKFVYGDLSCTGEGEPAEQELKSLERVKSIRHPYILSLERIEVVEGQLLIVMELADRNLWDRFKDCRTAGLPGVPREELLRYLDEAAEALDLMNHEYQLQHLDIKPQNLFLVHNHIKIADFGLVKDFEGKRGTITGGVTPVYAAPETFEGWVSRHSDQYSLAIVFQELLTGQRPFAGTTARQLLLQHLEMSPDVTPLSESDRRVILRALSKKPDQRFASCSDLVRALRESTSSNTGAHVSGVDKSRPPLSVNGNQCLVSTPSKSLSPTDKETPPSILTQNLGARSVHQTQMQPRDARWESGGGLEALSLPESALHAPSESASGVLFPAVIVGVGGVGGKVVQQLKAGVNEFCNGAVLPHLRYLVVDTDAEAIRNLASDAHSPLTKSELYHAALKRPAHYLRSETAGNLAKWLGEETLYKLPRNPDAATHRPFGRLAFADNSAALQKRLKADLETVCADAPLASAAAATGYSVRSRKPRVYVIAGLGGGTGGGAIVDFAYLARAALKACKVEDPEVIGLFLAPTSERLDAPISSAAANTIAAITELCHFSDDATVFEPSADAKAGLTRESAAPFARCVLLPLCESSTKGASALGQASGLLLRELMTPLGTCAEKERQSFYRESGLTLSSAATFRLAWPRERLKRCAALALSQKLLRDWQAREVPDLQEPLARWLEEEWRRRELLPDQIAERFELAGQELLGQPPAERFDTMLLPIEQAARQGEKINPTEVCRLLEQFFALTGHPGGQAPAGARRELPDHLEKKTKDLLRHCDVQVAEIANAIIEKPRHRIGGAEEALRQVGEWARKALGSYEPLAASLAREASETFRSAMALIGGVERAAPKAVKWKDKTGQELLSLLREVPRKLYQSLLADRMASVFRGVVGSVPEYLHEVNFCRQRLQRVESELAQRQAADSEDNPAFGPGRPILDSGDETLAAASERFIADMTTEEREEFDGLVQVRIADAMGTLVKFCLGSNSAVDALAELVIGAASDYLAGRLSADSSIDRLMHGNNQAAVQSLIRTAVDLSRPAFAGTGTRAAENTITLIAAPATVTGEEFYSLAADELKGLSFYRAESRDEIVVYRERNRLTPSELPYFSESARDAFRQYLTSCDVSPFSRQDVSWHAVK